MYDLDYDGQGNDGVISFTATPSDYENNVYTPGKFFIEIEGLAVKSQNGETRTAFIEMTLKDSCNPPVSISNPNGLQNQVYTLTDPDHPEYTPLDFVADPSYCQLEYTYSWTPLETS